jgi:regulator of cell morphogenesis and NO signaling
MLNSGQRLGQLVLEHAAAASVLRRHRIDFCCHGEVSLAEACAMRGVEVEALCRELSQAVAEEQDPRPVDPRTLTTDELLDQIVVGHHGYLREALPYVINLAEIVSTVHSAKDARLSEVCSVLRRLAEELLPHLDHEEQVLFPALRARRRRVRAIRRDLSTMADEHRAFSEIVARLRALTGGFTPPNDTCSTHKALLAELEALEADLFHHVHLENNVLAPRFEAS